MSNTEKQLSRGWPRAGWRNAAPSAQFALKLGVATVAVAAVGLPINNQFAYGLLVAAAVILAVGRVSGDPRRWIVALLLAGMAIGARHAIPVPAIEEGHNVYLPGGQSGLPAEVEHAMAAEFARAYPPSGWCQLSASGCWRNSKPPDRPYAFSFDGLYDHPAYSRRVNGIDVGDAEWQRLGFVNELAYNWYANNGNLKRAHRRRGFGRLLHPWQIDMPHFVMFNLPAAFAGSELCWRGLVMWEGADRQFTALPHRDSTCRTLTANDAGKRIFGIAVARDNPLTMRLHPTMAVRLWQSIPPALSVAAVLIPLLLLMRLQRRRLLLPAVFIGLAVVVMFASDATLLGGLRPFDGGDDGLVYDGWSRMMAQQFLSGHVVRALEGFEPVFYFTPGSRYLRTFEHFVFGETYFGYVSLLLLLPFLVFCFFRRWFDPRATLALTLVFMAIPVGALFGSTFYIYVKHAAHGYGDPAAAILFLAGTIALIGRARSGPLDRFAPAFGAGLLLAIALFVRPNLALGAAVLLGGAGLASLWQLQARRLAGMCLGFVPVLGMALHNWYFGHEFVLFSSHTIGTQSIPMPPSAYLAALTELLHLNFAGDDVRRGAHQIYLMLIGPSESFAMVPFHLAALVILVRVALSRRYEAWLRLTSGTALGLISPALFFIYSDRYHILAWLFMWLICCIWARDEGFPWLERRFLLDRFRQKPPVAWLWRRVDGLARAAGLVPALPERSTSAA